jgi:CubicO group peptidase (beta-lactamase class C family)
MQSISRSITAIIAIVAAHSSALSAQELTPLASSAIEGRWIGTAEMPHGLLGIALEVGDSQNNAWTAVFEIPAEGVRITDIAVKFSADSISLNLAPNRTLRAAVVRDSIAGMLDIEGNSMPVLFGRVGSEVASRIDDRLTDQTKGAARSSLQRIATGPASEGTDYEALKYLVSGADSANTHALVVLRDGQLVGTWYADGAREQAELMSVAKSVLNIAVGRLTTMGLIESLDVPVSTYFPEWRAGEGEEDITIRHLMAHTSGLEPVPPHEIYRVDDFVELALRSAVVTEPGGAWSYNNNATNLLAAVAGRAAGERLDHFVAKEVFGPLGIKEFGWSLDGVGNPHGMAGVRMYAEDLAKLGQLVLQRGKWGGERLIDPGWFEDSLRPASNWNDQSGLLWWLILEGEEIIGYRADGYLGQYLVIYPAEGLVGVRLVKESPAYNPQTDGFRRFQALLRDLAGAPVRAGCESCDGIP